MFDKYRIFRIVIYLKIYFPYENFFFDSSATKAGVNLILFLEDLEVFLTNDFEIFDHVISLHPSNNFNKHNYKTSNEALKFFFEIFTLQITRREKYTNSRRRIKKKREKNLHGKHTSRQETRKVSRRKKRKIHRARKRGVFAPRNNNFSFPREPERLHPGDRCVFVATLSTSPRRHGVAEDLRSGWIA